MQNIEEQARATYAWSIPLWLCYVDDTVTAIHKDEIDDFHEHLNRRKVDIKFSKEIEENGKISAFSRLLSHLQQQKTTNDNLQETRTDRLLDQSSYNPTSHNATTTLTRRAQLDCDSPDSLQDKTNYLNNIF